MSNIDNKEQEHLEQMTRDILNFAKDSVSLKTVNKTAKKLNLSQILSAMENPLKNVSTLQEASLYLKIHSGVYSRIVSYFANMLNYDYILYPAQFDNKKINADKLQKGYQETATYLERLNVKYNLSWIGKRLFELGEVYIFKIEDSEGVMFKEMPNDICRISSVQNNVCKYSIDLKKIQSNNDLYLTMPKEIQKLVDKYAKGSIKADKLVDNSWYELEENAYAFNIINPFYPKGYPPFAYLFDAIVHLMELEELEFTNAKIDNLKIIHQKIPMDKDGKLLIDINQARLYHEATKKNLPEGIAITTNPLDVAGITLHRTGNQVANHRNNAIKGVYDVSGVNSEIFNGSSTNTQGLINSVKSDELVAMELIGMFESFLNADLSVTKKTSGWRVKILDTTHFSMEEKIKMARENLAYGGSRLHFLSANGFTPLQSMNILKFEQSLDIDSLLVPQLTSHTITKDDLEGNNGKDKEDTSKKEDTKKTDDTPDK